MEVTNPANADTANAGTAEKENPENELGATGGETPGRSENSVKTHEELVDEDNFDLNEGTEKPDLQIHGEATDTPETETISSEDEEGFTAFNNTGTPPVTTSSRHEDSEPELDLNLTNDSLTSQPEKRLGLRNKARQDYSLMLKGRTTSTANPNNEGKTPNTQGKNTPTTEPKNNTEAKAPPQVKNPTEAKAPPQVKVTKKKKEAQTGTETGQGAEATTTNNNMPAKPSKQPEDRAIPAKQQEHPDDRALMAKQLEDQAKKIKDQATQITNLKTVIRQLEKTRNELTRELAEAQAINREVECQNKALKGALGNKNDTLTAKEEEARSLNAQLTKTTEERETLQSKVKSRETQIKELEEEVTRRDKIIDEHKDVIESFLNKLHTSQEETAEEPKRKLKSILLLADSNRRHILPQIEKQDGTAWTFDENTFKIEDLSDMIDNYENYKFEEISTTLIMLGTNNIKCDQDGKEEAKKLITTLKNLRKKFEGDIYVIELPPINLKIPKIERLIFNKCLHEEEERGGYTMIRAEEDFYKLPKEEILERDGIHLNVKGAGIIAKAISKTLQTNPPKSPKGQNTPTKEGQNTQARERQNTETTSEENHIGITHIPSQIIGQLIGERGSNIKSLEKKLNVKIHIDSNTSDPKARVKIQGNKSFVNNAINEINNITREREETWKRNEEKKEVTKNTPCAYYEQGNCNRGPKCRFSHQRPRTSRRPEYEDGACRDPRPEERPPPNTSRWRQRTPPPRRESDSDRRYSRDDSQDERRDVRLRERSPSRERHDSSHRPRDAKRRKDSRR